MDKKTKNSLNELFLKTGGLTIPPPQKRCFSTMFELLKDAEKYDRVNEIEVRNVTLTALCEYIERLKAQEEKSTVLKRLTEEDIIPSRDDNTYLK